MRDGYDGETWGTLLLRRVLCPQEDGQLITPGGRMGADYGTPDAGRSESC